MKPHPVSHGFMIAYADLTPYPNPLIHVAAGDADADHLTKKTAAITQLVHDLGNDAIAIRDQHREAIDALKTRLRVAQASNNAWRERALDAETALGRRLAISEHYSKGGSNAGESVKADVGDGGIVEPNITPRT